MPPSSPDRSPPLREIRRRKLRFAPGWRHRSGAVRHPTRRSRRVGTAPEGPVPGGLRSRRSEDRCCRGRSPFPGRSRERGAAQAGNNRGCSGIPPATESLRGFTARAVHSRPIRRLERTENRSSRTDRSRVGIGRPRCHRSLFGAEVARTVRGGYPLRAGDPRRPS
jgi:hypothetical protein